MPKKNDTSNPRKSQRLFSSEDDIFAQPQKLHKVDNADFERSVVHVAASKWLTGNNFSWRHEPRISVGIPDFIAHHADGRKIIVECKPDQSSYRTALRQLMDYHRHLGAEYACVFMIPKDDLISQVIKACATRNVEIVLLDCPLKPEDEKQKILALGHDMLFKKVVFMEGMYFQPQKYADEIVEFHRVNQTDATCDLENALKLIRHFIATSNESFSRLITTDEVESIFTPLLNELDGRPYKDLCDVSNRWGDCLYIQVDTRKKLAREMIQRYGIVPPGMETEFEWEAKKQSEFYAMANMVDLFNYEEGETEYDAYTFFNESGGIVSDSLIWEGSAHSFETAQEWDQWRKAQPKITSYFDQFEFTHHQDVIDIAATSIQAEIATGRKSSGGFNK